jgi:hypothetical protein
MHSFLKGNLEIAKLGGGGSNANGYKWVAHEACRHLFEGNQLIEGDPDAIKAKKAEFNLCFKAECSEPILKYFEKELPELMKHVPKRRYRSFYKGICEAWHEGLI